MIDIDLTLTDEEDDEIVIIKGKTVEEYQHNKPRSSQIDKDVYSFFYGTEDKIQQFLSIQHPAARKIAKNSYKIRCTKCRQHFSNFSFIDHIIDHYCIDLHTLDSLLLPKWIFSIVNQHWCAVKCEICDLQFTSLITLGQHLEGKHVYKDMPYVCFVCNFYQTSFLWNLKRHFYDYHKNTEFLVCPFCIELFELSPLNGDCDVLDASVFVAHLDKHVTKRQYSCDKCTLKYIHKTDLIYHKTVYHQGRDIPANEEFIGEDIAANHSQSKSITQRKSLNVSSQPINISKLTIQPFPQLLPFSCSECHEHISSSTTTIISSHYQPLSAMCSLCGYSSYCSSSFKRHMKTVHTTANSSSSRESTSTVDLCLTGVCLCPCGFQTLHGDKMAKHLTECVQQHCVVRPRSILECLLPPSSSSAAAAVRSDDNLLACVPSSSSLLSVDSDFFKILQLEKIVR